jgi:tetratricopeptide (TPR) repeat protein
MHRFLPIVFGLLPPILFGSVAPGSSRPVDVASTRNALGIVDLRAGDTKAAEAKFREAIDLASAALGESHPDVALYEANLAVALGVEHQYGRAEILLRRARYILEVSQPSQDDRLATVLTEISAVETAERQFVRAEADAEQSLAIVSRHSALDSIEVAVQQVVLATVYIRERKTAEADEILPAAVATERRLLADPATSDRRILAQGLRMLADLRALQQNWREAQALYAEVIAIYESTSAGSHPSLAPILLRYAEVLKHCGVPREQVRSVETRARAIRNMKA